jgi:hypothetical protein
MNIALGLLLALFVGIVCGLVRLRWREALAAAVLTADRGGPGLVRSRERLILGARKPF